MTNEEAIDELEVIYERLSHPEDCEQGVYSFRDGDYLEALDMAIKALEQQSCEDAISREAVLDVIEREEFKGDAISEIEKLPSVIPQPKIGKWVAQDIHNCHTDFKCSACGYIHGFMHLYGKPTADYTYCPNCGADMRESEEEE